MFITRELSNNVGKLRLPRLEQNFFGLVRRAHFKNVHVALEMAARMSDVYGSFQFITGQNPYLNQWVDKQKVYYITSTFLIP